jgi:hypothetical protein
MHSFAAGGTDENLLSQTHREHDSLGPLDGAGKAC